MDANRFASVLAQYGKKYDIRFCREDECGRLMEFIGTYWKEGHVLSTSRELMDWQYHDGRNRRYNFVLAIHRESGEIHGILGFIPTDLFDAGIQTPMRWGAIWKVRDDVAARGLGLALKFYMYQNAPAPYAGGIGLSDDSKAINSKMGEELGQLKHYYMVNESMDQFSLLRNPPARYGGCANDSGGSTSEFAELSEGEFLRMQGEYSMRLLPYKSAGYYVGRFFRHPAYEYHCIAYRGNEGDPTAILFYRLAEHAGARCVMVVDFVGDEWALEGASHAFQKLLSENGAEYLSFYEYGLEDGALLAAGLCEKSPDVSDEFVLPLYYEPFEQRNVQIDYHYFSDDSVERRVCFFKGDADQDRPNAAW